MAGRVLGIHQLDRMNQTAAKQHCPDAVDHRASQQRIVFCDLVGEGFAPGEFWDSSLLRFYNRPSPATSFAFFAARNFSGFLRGWDNVKLRGIAFLLPIFWPGFIDFPSVEESEQCGL